jgi:PAS domain S-box-containing protein
MDSTVYVAMVHNAALLVALSALYGLVYRLRGRRRVWLTWSVGALFGMVAVAGMMLPFPYAPGIIYDGRSIVLSMAGLFGGPAAAGISVLIAGAYRAFLGGAGIWAGLATIVGCSLVGLVFRRACGGRPDRLGILALYALGISAHVVMLACQLVLLPRSAGMSVVERVWLPVMVIYPLATVLMGLLLRGEDRRWYGERELDESQELLVRSQSIGMVGSWELEVETGRLKWSREVYRIFGVEPGSFPGTYEAFLQCVHQDDREAVELAYTQSVNEGREGYETRHRIVRPATGEVRYVHEKCEHHRDAAGCQARSVGFVQDITDRVATEKTLNDLTQELELRVLQRTRELEESNRSLEDFARSVSHDLRAPLRAISGFAGIIARRHRAGLDEEGRRYLANILEAAATMEELIRDLLDYARLGGEAGEPSAVPLRPLVEEIVSGFSQVEDMAGTEIIVDQDLPVVRGVPVLLRQVFTNLIENALKFRRQGVAHRVEITGWEEGGWAVVRVVDNGIGIAPEYLNKIFDMFQRLHSKERYPGTGIGLAVVRRAMALMGGEVGVESEPGKGSVFIVKFQTGGTG